MESAKLKIAIEFLKDGKSFPVEGLRFEIGDNNTFIVIGWSDYLNFENLTKKNSLIKLELIKDLFKYMCETSAELRDFIIGKEVVYQLYYDDAGKLSIPICLERSGIVKWEANIKD